MKNLTGTRTMLNDKPIYANESRIQIRGILKKCENTYDKILPSLEPLQNTDSTQGKKYKPTVSTGLRCFQVMGDEKSVKRSKVEQLLASHQRSGEDVTKHATSKQLPFLVYNVPKSLKSSIQSTLNEEDADFDLKNDSVVDWRPTGARNVRICAGSDNPSGQKYMSVGYNNCCNQQNGGRTNAQRPSRSIWERNENALPSLRAAFQDQNSSTQPRRTAPQRSRIPIPCSRMPPRRQDNPVQLYLGSRLPVPNRPGPAQARIPRPRGAACRNNSNVRTRRSQSMSHGRRCAHNVPQDPCDNRRGTYDVAPQQQDPCDNRRGTCDVPPQQPDPCGNRRGTYDVPPQQQDPCGNRRGTYDVPPQQQDPCGNRRDTYDVQQPNCAGPSRSGTFTMSGTIRMDDDVEELPAGQPIEVSACFRSPSNTSQTVDDFLDNAQNFDTVAPRSLAVPGCPYVAINDSGSSSVPEQWQEILDDRSSIGSQALSIDASPFNDRGFHGCDDSDSDNNNDVSGSDDCGCSPTDRDSRPFGLDDSCPMSSALGRAPDYPSRTRSVDRAPTCSRRRDFSFNRHTR